MTKAEELKSYTDTVIFYITRSLYVYGVVAVVLLVAGNLNWFLGFTWGAFGALLIFRLHSLTIAKVPNQRNPAMYMRFHYTIRLLIFAIFVIIAARQQRLNVYTTIFGLFIVKIAIYLFRQK